MLSLVKVTAEASLKPSGMLISPGDLVLVLRSQVPDEQVLQLCEERDELNPPESGRFMVIDEAGLEVEL